MTEEARVLDAGVFNVSSGHDAKGTSKQAPVIVPGSRLPLTVYTGFSNETALSVYKTRLHRRRCMGTCL